MELSPWRVVESQFVNSTRKLVDSAEEQALLESLIDGAKPPVGVDIQSLKLHYLLFTPFRHPPLRNGSRFGTKTERGVFYGARELETCLAEVAYYRLVFLEGSPNLPRLETAHSAFQVQVRTQTGVDLTEPPFDAHTAVVSSRTDYTATQVLGREMRADGVEVCLYRSARALQRGTNVAVFSPSAFASPYPFGEQVWSCSAERERVEFRRRSLLTDQRRSFDHKVFLVDRQLPSPATR